MADFEDHRILEAAPGDGESKDREEQQTQETPGERGEDTGTGGEVEDGVGTEAAKEGEARGRGGGRGYRCRLEAAC